MIGLPAARRVIDYYFTTMSPWAYLGHAPFMELARRHEAQVVFHPVPLLTVFPESGGLPLAKRHPLRQRYRMIELQRWRDKRRMSFKLEPRFWPFDASVADRAVLALAKTRADPDLFVRAAFAACWDQDRNIADPDELLVLLREAGCDGQAILADARSDAVAAAYADEGRMALAAGVFGSPSYGLAGEIFWGQDRLDLLDDALATGRPAFQA